MHYNKSNIAAINVNTDTTKLNNSYDALLFN